MSFELISRINVEDPSTWEGKQFITLDIDWVPDAVLDEVVELFESLKLPATWFVTHQTPVLERLRSNPLVELGIHPNFNPLLFGGEHRRHTHCGDVVEELMTIVPEARSVRSHSMTQSSPLLDVFVDSGLTHECNHFIPAEAGMKLVPWYSWNGLGKIPFFWEDDVDILYGFADRSILRCHDTQGLRVFNFHPAHIFLNSRTLENYTRCKDDGFTEQAFRKHMASGYGTRSKLLELAEARAPASPRL